MKLPADKKERVKVLIAIAIGVVVVIYGLAVLVVKPFYKEKSDCIEKIATLKGQLKRAELARSRIESDKASLTKALSELNAASGDQGVVLRARLGNFLLGASEIIDGCARAANVSGQVVTENGISQIPQGKKDAAPSAFSIYSVTVRLEAGVQELLPMLQALERGNPYLCVSGLVITGQEKKPGRHMISFDVQWPIWVDPEMPQKLHDQLEDLAETGAPAKAAGSTENPSK